MGAEDNENMISANIEQLSKEYAMNILRDMYKEVPLCFSDKDMQEVWTIQNFIESFMREVNNEC